MKVSQSPCRALVLAVGLAAANASAETPDGASKPDTNVRSEASNPDASARAETPAAPSSPDANARTATPDAASKRDTSTRAEAPHAPARPDASTERVEIVVLGTRTKESSQRAQVRTEVVTRDEAERRGARTVGEALAGETSLQVQPNAYRYVGAPSGIQMQGLDGNRVLVLEDGEPVLGDANGIVDLDQLPLTSVERIEYVTGPMSALYGTNALGGVINVITAPPPHWGLSGRGRLERRSYGEFQGEASSAFRGRAGWASLDGSLRHRPGVPLGAGPELVAPEHRTELLALRAGAALSSRIELTLKARWVRDEERGVVTEEVPGRAPIVVDVPERTARLTLHAAETIRLGPGTRLDLSLRRTFFENETVDDRRTSDVVDERRERALVAQSAEAVLTTALGPEGTLVVGARSDAERFSAALERYVARNGELVRERVPEVQPTVLASAAAFGQIGYRLTPALGVMAGVRAEQHDRYGGVLAPRAAIALTPFPELTVRASVGRGFRAPTAKERAFTFDHSSLGYEIVGNPELEPETSLGINADATLRPNPSLTLRAAGFSNWVRDLIEFALDPVQPRPNVNRYRYVNVAQARTAGGDFSVRVRAPRGFSASAGYAYLWSRDEATGQPLSHRPEHTLTLAMGLDLPSGLVAYARYRRTNAAFVTEAIESPGFDALDARVAYRPHRSVELYFGALNILDAHRDPARGGDARPTLGRTLYLGVSAELWQEEEPADEGSDS
nr:MAG: TonB-dependent receptor [Pseudomonadota bacterium]